MLIVFISYALLLDADKKPCSDSFLNQCDIASTKCNDSLGYVECVCRPGFEKINGERECKQQIFNMSKMCQFLFNFNFMIKKVVRCPLSVIILWKVTIKTKRHSKRKLVQDVREHWKLLTQWCPGETDDCIETSIKNKKDKINCKNQIGQAHVCPGSNHGLVDFQKKIAKLFPSIRQSVAWTIHICQKYVVLKACAY